MTPMTRLAFAALLLAAPALAQPNDPPALAGPAVRAADGSPSLVQRDFAGKVKRLEEPADEAALALLDLTPAQKEQADTILAQRHALLDRIVLENLLTISRLPGAPEEERRGILRELTEKLRPLRERGPLADELGTTLTREQLERHATLVREYFAAVADEPTEGMGDRPRRDRAGAVGREFVQQIGVAVRRSYERTLGQRQKEFEETLAALDLTPEQDAKVRKIVIDAAQKALSAGTTGEGRAAYNRADAERRATILAVMNELTPEQRRALIERATGR